MVSEKLQIHHGLLIPVLRRGRVGVVEPDPESLASIERRQGSTNQACSNESDLSYLSIHRFLPQHQKAKHINM